MNRRQAVPKSDWRRAKRVDQVIEVLGVLAVMAIALMAIGGLFLLGGAR
jgi:glucokinase